MLARIHTDSCSAGTTSKNPQVLSTTFIFITKLTGCASKNFLYLMILLILTVKMHVSVIEVDVMFWLRSIFPGCLPRSVAIIIKSCAALTWRSQLLHLLNWCVELIHTAEMQRNTHLISRATLSEKGKYVVLNTSIYNRGHVSLTLLVTLPTLLETKNFREMKAKVLWVVDFILLE